MLRRRVDTSHHRIEATLSRLANFFLDALHDDTRVVSSRLSTMLCGISATIFFFFSPSIFMCPNFIFSDFSIVTVLHLCELCVVATKYVTHSWIPLRLLQNCDAVAANEATTEWTHALPPTSAHPPRPPFCFRLRHRAVPSRLVPLRMSRVAATAAAALRRAAVRHSAAPLPRAAAGRDGVRTLTARRARSAYVFDGVGGGGGGGADMWEWPITKTNTVFNIVPQGHKYVVERFGKLHSVQESGWFLAIPLVDRLAYVIDVRERALDIAPQAAITRDNGTLRCVYGGGGGAADGS